MRQLSPISTSKIRPRKNKQEKTSKYKHIGKIADGAAAQFHNRATKRCLLCSLGLGIFTAKIGSRGGLDGTA
jgi:hypothetical protein